MSHGADISWRLPAPLRRYHNQILRSTGEASKPRRRDPRDSRRQECDVCSLESQAEENSSAPGRLTPSVRVPCKQQRLRWSPASQSSCCLSIYILSKARCHTANKRREMTLHRPQITADFCWEALRRGGCSHPERETRQNLVGRLLADNGLKLQ